MTHFKERVSANQINAVKLAPMEMKACGFKLGTAKVQDLFKVRYSDKVQVCMLPDLEERTDYSLVIGRTFSTMDKGTALAFEFRCAGSATAEMILGRRVQAPQDQTLLPEKDQQRQVRQAIDECKKASLIVLTSRRSLSTIIN